MDNFCGFKTAYLLDREFDNLTDALCEDTFFEIMGGASLPEGWTFRGTDISGAAGHVVLFDIEDIPTERQLKEVDAELRRLNEL